MIPKRKILAYAKKHIGVREIRIVYGGAVEFPVLIFIYSEKQHVATSHLKETLTSICYTTKDICHWCYMHEVEYHIYIPILDRILPWRRLKYQRAIKM